jgi:hypothetical protein
VTEYDYVCLLCNEKTTESSFGLNDSPCVNASCDGVRRRVWSFFLSQVPGAGGSPGKRAGG